MTKIPRCPVPTEPGSYICRRIPRASPFLATVERNPEGCLTIWGTFGKIAISEIGSEAKWWGPIELSKR